MIDMTIKLMMTMRYRLPLEGDGNRKFGILETPIAKPTETKARQWPYGNIDALIGRFIVQFIDLIDDDECGSKW